MAGVRNNLKDLGIQRVPDVVREMLNKYSREDLRTGIPARVVNTGHYESIQCVSVQPLFNTEYQDGRVLKSSIIEKVFVRLQEGGGFKIKLPIAVGDLVTLQYSSKYLGSLLDSDGTRNIDVPEGFYTSERDCWVEHGFGTRRNNQSPSKDNLIIEGKNTTITITPSGQVSVETSGTSVIKSSGHTIDAPTTTITGDLAVEGSSLTVSGAEVYQHNHNGSVPPFE